MVRELNKEYYTVGTLEYALHISTTVNFYLYSVNL